MGAENSVTLCDLQVFVYEATEPVSSQRPDGRSGVRRGAASGRLLMERSVRTVGVVVLDVLAQHRREVARSGDQEMVEAFTAQGADEAFRDRVRSRCPTGVRMMRMSAPAKTASKAAVNLLSRSRIRNRNRAARSPRSMSRLRACWVTQAPVGWAVIPAMCTRRLPCSITTRM